MRPVSWNSDKVILSWFAGGPEVNAGRQCRIAFGDEVGDGAGTRESDSRLGGQNEFARQKYVSGKTDVKDCAPKRSPRRPMGKLGVTNSTTPRLPADAG